MKRMNNGFVFLFRDGSGSARAVRSSGSGCQEEDPRGLAEAAPSPEPQETGQSHPNRTLVRWYWQEAVRTSLHGQERWASCVLQTHARTPLPQSFIHPHVFHGEYWYMMDFIPCDHEILCMFFFASTSICDFHSCLIFHLLLSFVLLCVCVFSVRSCLLYLCTYIMHLTSKYPLLPTHETSHG